MKIKHRSLLGLLIILTFFSAPINLSKANTDYSLAIKKNATYEWEVTFVHENVSQLLNYKTVGIIYDLGFKVKVIVKEIESWYSIWQIWCEEYPNPFGGYYYSNYVVYKFPLKDIREINLNIRADRSSIFSAKPVETYLSECSAKNPALVSNGTTIVSYIQGDETDYLYRAEGEYSEGTGILKSVKYYLNTDELIFQWDLLSKSKFIPGYILPPFIILILFSTMGIAYYVFKKNRFMRLYQTGIVIQ